MTQKRWLTGLGALGLLGLVGVFTGNPGFYGFFGFFGFLGFARVTYDERFAATVQRAALAAFITGMLVFAAANIAMALIGRFEVYAVAFGISFLAQLLVFTGAVQYFDRSGG